MQSQVVDSPDSSMLSHHGTNRGAPGSSTAAVLQSGRHQTIVPEGPLQGSVNPPDQVPPTNARSVTLSSAVHRPLTQNEWDAYHEIRCGNGLVEVVAKHNNVSCERILQFWPEAKCLGDERTNYRAMAFMYGIPLEWVMACALRKGGAINLALDNNESFDAIQAWSDVPIPKIVECASGRHPDVMSHAALYLGKCRTDFAQLNSRMNSPFAIEDLLFASMRPEGSVCKAVQAGEAFEKIQDWSGFPVDMLLKAYAELLRCDLKGNSLEQIANSWNCPFDTVLRVWQATFRLAWQNPPA